jgi:hypothetical protein
MRRGVEIVFFKSFFIYINNKKPEEKTVKNNFLKGEKDLNSILFSKLRD